MLVFLVAGVNRQRDTLGMKTTGHADEMKAEIESKPKKRAASEQHRFDPDAFDAAIAKWMGSGRERMRELGFATTEEYMKAIRGR